MEPGFSTSNVLLLLPFKVRVAEVRLEVVPGLVGGILFLSLPVRFLVQSAFPHLKGDLLEYLLNGVGYLSIVGQLDRVVDALEVYGDWLSGVIGFLKVFLGLLLDCVCDLPIPSL